MTLLQKMFCQHNYKWRQIDFTTEILECEKCGKIKCYRKTEGINCRCKITPYENEVYNN